MSESTFEEISLESTNYLWLSYLLILNKYNGKEVKIK